MSESKKNDIYFDEPYDMQEWFDIGSDLRILIRENFNKLKKINRDQATHYESKIAELENVLKEMVKVRYGLQGYVEDDDLQGERDYLAGLLFGPDGHETKARQALKDLAEWRKS